MSSANTTKVKARFVDVDIEGDAAVIGAALAPVIQALFGTPVQAAAAITDASAPEQPSSPAASELPEPIARRARAVGPAPSVNGAAPAGTPKFRAARGGGKSIAQRAWEYLLAHGEAETTAIAEGLGESRAAVYQALTKQVAAGGVVQPRPGVWAAERVAAGN